MKHRETYYTPKIKSWLESHLNWKLVRTEGLMSETGVADLIGWTPTGGFVAVEVKLRGIGTLEPLQRIFLDSSPRSYVAEVYMIDKVVCVDLKNFHDAMRVQTIFTLMKER
jgi:hypothetical protein